MIGLIIVTGIIGLLAGLVISIIATRDKKGCYSCKHKVNEFDFDEPCCKCKRMYGDKWEEDVE